VTQRNAQLVRLLRVLRDLDRLGGADLYELAERYGTTTRTIRRDLAALQEAGLPIMEESVGKRKRWRVAFKDHLQRLSELIDASHYLALRVAMGPLHATSPLFAALEDLSDKLETVIGEKERELLQVIDRCFYSYEKFGYRRAQADVFWPLVTAISDRRLCRVSYRRPEPDAPVRKYRILPLRIFAYQRTVYFHAHVPRHDNIVVLNLQRVKSLEVLKQRGTVPKQYDPAKWEESTFGVFGGGKPQRYRLHFDAAAAPYIRERTWHPTQRLRKRRGGGVELTFTCSESPEVTAWVASWRRSVEVVEPESLRAELAEVGQWLGETYGG